MLPLAFSITYFIVLPILGCVAGILGGLLGVGGGLVIIPVLLLVLGERFGEGSLHVYKLAALISAVVLSIPAAGQHFRARAVIPSMLWGVLPLSVVGVAAGVGTARLLAGSLTQVLQQIFGAFMILFVAVQVWQRRRLADGTRAGPDRCPAPWRSTYLGLWIGLPSGIIAGLLGVGGGVWAVPVQHMKFGITMRHAIANSTCAIVGIAAAAALAQSIAVASMPDLRWDAGWRLAMGLAPGSVVGGLIGGGLAHRVPQGKLRVVFQFVLVLTGIRLLFA